MHDMDPINIYVMNTGLWTCRARSGSLLRNLFLTQAPPSDLSPVKLLLIFQILTHLQLYNVNSLSPCRKHNAIW